MAAYAVSYKFRADNEGRSASEVEAGEPMVNRVAASDATRAISQVINTLKTDGEITSKSDIKVLEAKVVA